MNEMQSCQSCGMPVTGEEVKGTEKNGDKCNEYCIYCYKDGEFLVTFDEIVGYCLEHPENWGGDKLTREEAEIKIKAYISGLGRWKPVQ